MVNVAVVGRVAVARGDQPTLVCAAVRWRVVPQRLQRRHLIAPTSRPPRSSSVWLATNTGTTGSAAMYAPLIAPHIPCSGERNFAQPTPSMIPANAAAI